MANPNWIENLKVGDEVAVQVEEGRIEMGRVTKRTKTCVVVNVDWLPMIDYRFKPSDCGMDLFGKARLERPTDFIRAIQPLFNIARKVYLNKLSELSIDQLRRIAQILDEPKEADHE